MEQKEELKPTRRIMDVNVREVSLVDRAANLRSFLVVKRLEGNMDETVKGEEVRKAEDPERVETPNPEISKEEPKPEVASVEPEKVEAEKACGGSKDEDKKKAGGSEDEEDEEEMKRKNSKKSEEEKGMNPAAISAILRSMKGAPKEAVKEIVSWLESKKSDSEANVSKDLQKESEDEIQKSKRFTPSRTESLKKTALDLLKLLGEIDVEAMKSIVDSFKSSNVAKQEGEKEMDQKSEKDPNVEKLESELTETKAKLEEKTKKLEEIEKSRLPSKSVEGEGGTDKKETKKSFWTGVL
jgi:hypothetical protein